MPRINTSVVSVIVITAEQALLYPALSMSHSLLL